MQMCEDQEARDSLAHTNVRHLDSDVNLTGISRQNIELEDTGRWFMSVYLLRLELILSKNCQIQLKGPYVNGI